MKENSLSLEDFLKIIKNKKIIDCYLIDAKEDFYYGFHSLILQLEDDLKIFIRCSIWDIVKEKALKEDKNDNEL